MCIRDRLYRVFFFNTDPDGGELEGNVYVIPLTTVIPPPNLEVDLGKPYSDYLQLCQTLNGTSIQNFSDFGNELLSHDQYKDLLIDEYPVMTPFNQAVFFSQ